MPTFTILEAEGNYADAEHYESALRVLQGSGDGKVDINFIASGLLPIGLPLKDHAEGPGCSKDPTQIDSLLQARLVPGNARPVNQAQVDGILSLKLPFTADDLPLFPNLKVILRMGVGVDILDRKALAARNVVVCNVPDYGTEEIADHAIASAVALRRGLLAYHDLMREPNPIPWHSLPLPISTRIRGATFGLVALGRIGIATALRAKAFGWNVIYYDPYAPVGSDKALGVERVRTIEELFSRSSVVSLHCPLTEHTDKLVSSRLLDLLPSNAIVVNVARGEVIDMDALYTALKSNKIAAAALDVVPGEPLSTDPAKVHPLFRAYQTGEEWLRGRFLLTPHAAWYSPEGTEEIRTKSIQAIRDVLIDGLDTNIYPPEAH